MGHAAERICALISSWFNHFVVHMIAFHATMFSNLTALRLNHHIALSGLLCFEMQINDSDGGLL